jgi:DNA helicase-2/ATP-dependent DNA helicase PcrA
MLSGIFSHAKNHSLSPLAFLRETGQPTQVIDAFQLYEKRLKEANALDFDDLLLCTIRLFEMCPDVLEKYRERFRYILVDEYQDTNLAQYHIVNLLAKVHRNLCVVGDDDQSIYAWRGADIRNILEFEKDFEGCKVIRLEQNYRSTERILDAANAVIHNNKGRKEKTLWTAEKGGEPIDVHEANDERDEAYYICSRIANAARLGSRYDDFAILYRTHAQSRVLEMQLKSFLIPYRVYGGVSFFSRAEVKDILAYLRLILNPADDEAFLRAVNLPPRGIGAKRRSQNIFRR